MAKNKIPYSAKNERRNKSKNVKKRKQKHVVEAIVEKKQPTHMVNENIRVPVKHWKRIQRLEKKETKVRQNRLKELNERPFFIDDREDGSVGQRVRLMKDPEWRLGYGERRKTDFRDFETYDEFYKYLKILNERSEDGYFVRRDAILQENYLKKFIEGFGSEVTEPLNVMGNVSLYDYLASMGSEEFYFFYMQNDSLDFEVFYPDEKLGDLSYMRMALERIVTSVLIHKRDGLDRDMVIMNG